MKEKIKEILDIPAEDKITEFKRLGNGDRVVCKVVETIVAMANTDGGKIILGIDDPEKSILKNEKRIIGIEENLENFDEIGRNISRIQPSIPHIWPPERLLFETGKTIAIINIPKSAENFHEIDGKVFIRLEKGNSNPLTAHEIIKFSYLKGFSHADNELVDVDLELLRTEYYDQWRINRNIYDEDIGSVFLKTGLARKNKYGNIKPTIAAVMLFALYPSDLLNNKCEIRIFQYPKTKEEIVSDTLNLTSIPHIIKGPLILQIKDTHEYVLNILKAGMKIPGSGFITTYYLPERAIKEVITNAVIHRDYNLQRPVEIKIFSNRIEVDSPGLFPSNITLYNIGFTRADGYRNSLVVKHLREFPNPPNLDQNEGVRLIRNEMQESNLYPPVFTMNPISKDGISVRLFSEKVDERWNKIYEFLIEKEKYINNELARKLLKVENVYSISKLLSKFFDMGLLIKIESNNKKNIKYRLPVNKIN